MITKLMKNLEIAKIFYAIADILEMQDVQFKPQAYRKAARNIESMEKDIEEVYKERKLGEIPGVGEAIAKKIKEIIETGKLKYYEELKKDFPEGLQEIISIPGMGPKTAKLLYQALGISNLEQLRKAAEEGRLRGIKGLGEKTEENILKGIEMLSETKGRMLLGYALPIAQKIVASLKASCPISKISPAGSLRRMKETIGDIDILAVSNDWQKVMDTFTSLPQVAEVKMKGETKATVILKDGVQADIRVVEAGSFGSALQYFTGSKDHNIHLRTIARERGLKISEYGIFRGEEKIGGEEERELYRILGMEYIEPELREDRGEIDLAMKSELPNLIEEKDIRGDFHVHTKWSDGSDSIEDLVEVAKKKGYEFLAVTDHSSSLHVAKGLTEEEVLQQRDKIREINKEMRGFKVFSGTEVDIRENGDLDFGDEVLKELDVVVGAVHSKFKMQEEEMTRRLIVAMENENMDILAHPTNRLIGEREPSKVDMEALVQKAVETETILEINAFINRLDLSGSHAKLAKDYGAKIAIGTDAHTRLHLDLMKYGVGTARRGWLEPKDVLNCWDLEELTNLFT